MSDYHGSEKWKKFEIFTDYLLGLIEDLPEEVLQEVKHSQLVSIFSKFSKLLEFSNQYLNNLFVFSLPKEQLVEYIRMLVSKYRLKRNQIWWFSNLVFEEKQDLPKFQLLKKYERLQLTNMKQFQNMKLIEKKGGKKNIKIKNIPEKKENFLQQFSKDNDSCKQCTLYNESQVLFDFSNMEDIDILFVFEAPGETEVQQGVPVIGRAGQLFRKYLQDYIISNNLSWFITNTCLCRPPENRTPTKNEINLCSPFLEKVIQYTNPKLIVASGSTAKDRFEIKKSGILNIRGLYKYVDSIGKERDVFLTVHPSYLLRNNDYHYFDEDFQSIVSFFKNEVNEQNLDNSNELQNKIQSPEITKIDGKWTIKLEDWIYDYNLVEVEHVKFRKSVLYTLQKENVKKYFWAPDVFYFFAKEGYGQAVEDMNDLAIIEGIPTYEHPKGMTFYESDISVETRHVVDYYFVQNTLGKKNNYQPRVAYFDIEVFSEDGEFIPPSQATAPIVLISIYKTTTNKLITYVLGSQIPNTENTVFVSTEQELINKFCKEITQDNIDILTAWNISYDLPYIYNRMRKLFNNHKIFSELSPLKINPMIDAEKNVVRIAGLVTPDLLTYYKIMTYGNRDSYRLDFISELELGEGKTEGHGSEFWTIWNKDKAKAIRYNQDDVKIIKRLDDKLQIINFFNTIRLTSHCNWRDMEQMSKKVDSLLLSFSKMGGLL